MNAFTNVTYLLTEIDCIRTCIKKTSRARGFIIAMMDGFIEAFQEHTKEAILEALPPDEGTGEPREALKEIYKSLRDSIMILDESASYPEWENIT